MEDREFSYKDVFVYLTFTLFNLLTHESYLNLLLSLPQIICVLVLIFKGKYRKAFFYHLLFTITCLAVPFSYADKSGDVNFIGLFNYSKLKLFGPIGVYHVILTLLVFLNITKRKVFNEFRLLHKFLVFLFLFGVLFGLLGIAFSDYYLKHFITYTIYVLVIIIHVILFRILHTKDFARNTFRMVVSVLISSPIASMILYFSGIFVMYGNSEIPIINEAGYYSIFLILAFFQFKRFILPVISSLFMFFLTLKGATGGKGIILVGIAFVIFVAFLFFKTQFYKFRVKLLQLFFGLSIVVLLIMNLSFTIENKLFLHKLNSVFRIFSVFKGINYLHLIPESPRIRIVSMINIFYDNIKNPLALLFGKGFGSYFTDHMQLLRTMNLDSAFQENEILSGKYPRPHDTVVAVPLSNGVIGLIYLFYVSYKYLGNIRVNLLSCSVIPWLLLTFFYNSQFAIVGLIMLYASFYKFKN